MKWDGIVLPCLEGIVQKAAFEESHIHFFLAVNTKNKYLFFETSETFTATNFFPFLLSFWTFLKDAEDWRFKAVKGFALLFYENLEDLKILGLGRDIWGSSPTSLIKQVHLEQIV